MFEKPIGVDEARFDLSSLCISEKLLKSLAPYDQLNIYLYAGCLSLDLFATIQRCLVP